MRVCNNSYMSRCAANGSSSSSCPLRVCKIREVKARDVRKIRTIHNTQYDQRDALASVLAGLESKLQLALGVCNAFLSAVVVPPAGDERTFGVLAIDAQDWRVDHLGDGGGVGGHVCA